MTLLTITDLNLALAGKTLVEEVSLTIAPGETVGLVGESGSGKSMTARAVIGLTPPGAQLRGSIRFGGEEILGLRGKALRALRARRVAMIFQDPRAHINPVRGIGDFLTEAMTANLGMSAKAAAARAVQLMKEVGIADGERRMRQYPHELSGGLLQRVMIASVLAVEPELILADEPTTALDVTTQSEVMAILDEARRERGTAMLLITHDLELAAATCDRLAVMYAGRIVERYTDSPRHPYTTGLLKARPELFERPERLHVIPGRPVAAFEADEGCAFAPRCPHTQPICLEDRPPLADDVACVRVEELA